MYAPESTFSNSCLLKDTQGPFLSMKCESSSRPNPATCSELDKQISKAEISPYSVVIGRGKVCQEYIGNQRLEVLAKTKLQQFAEATSKDDKSKVVTFLVDTVHKNGGSFLKLVDTGFVEVNMRGAREKVGVVLRNLVGPDKYRSSCKSKVVARRKRVQARRKHGNNLASSAAPSAASTSSERAISLDNGSLDKLLSCDIILELPGDDGDVSSIASSQDFSLEDDLESLGTDLWEI